MASTLLPIETQCLVGNLVRARLYTLHGNDGYLGYIITPPCGIRNRTVTSSWWILDIMTNDRSVMLRHVLAC